MSGPRNIHDQADMQFYRGALKHARRGGDRAAARHWVEMLNSLIYMRQAARDRAAKAASMRSVPDRCVTDIAAPESVTVAGVTDMNGQFYPCHWPLSQIAPGGGK